MKKLLVADDSWIARKSIIKFISSDDWDIIEAENGETALEQIDAASPDLVLLDLLMPKPDGIDVLQELAGREQSPPVIVMTADIQETTKRKCLDFGAVRFLKKPPRKEEVVKAVKEVLELETH